MATLTIDPKDPCGAHEALSAVYYNLISGQAAQIVAFKAGPNAVERQVTYHKADIAALRSAIKSFENQCDALQGKKPRRHAIFSGGVR